MQKAIMSPLCSGLVIPGLGQIINQDLKKGIIILYKTPQAIEKEKAEIIREAKRYDMSVRYSPKYRLSEESGERQFVIISYK
jgi:hypothetical protein